MTRRLTTTALALLFALPIMAQPRFGRPGGGGPGGPGGPGRGLEFLTGYLSLTDAQKTQAEAIFDAAETASETLRGQLTSANDAVKAAVKANKSDSELDTLAAAVGVVQGKLTAIRAKADAKFYALLTADQKVKYDELRDRSGPGRK